MCKLSPAPKGGGFYLRKFNLKRDLDLVRSILLVIESQDHGSFSGDLEVNGFTDEEIGYHVYLMGQAGLIDASDVTNMDSPSPYAIAHSITWYGHDFLDSAKDPTIWEKAKNTILKPVGGVAFEVVTTWLKFEAMKKLGIS